MVNSHFSLPFFYSNIYKKKSWNTCWWIWWGNSGLSLLGQGESQEFLDDKRVDTLYGQLRNHYWGSRDDCQASKGVSRFNQIPKVKSTPNILSNAYYEHSIYRNLCVCVSRSGWMLEGRRVCVQIWRNIGVGGGGGDVQIWLVWTQSYTHPPSPNQSPTYIPLLPPTYTVLILEQSLTSACKKMWIDVRIRSLPRLYKKQTKNYYASHIAYLICKFATSQARCRYHSTSQPAYELPFPS